MWIKIDNKLPPVGDCSNNLLLLWIKCPEDIPYPEYYMGYEIGFYDGNLFIDKNYRYRIDNVEYWCLLQGKPDPQGGKKKQILDQIKSIVFGRGDSVTKIQKIQDLITRLNKVAN